MEARATSGSLEEALFAIVSARATGASWIDACEGLRDPLDLSTFHVLFARAARALGTEPLVLSAREQAAVSAANGRAPLAAWSVDHAGRVALVLRASRALVPGALASLIDDLFYRGENREREAVLRALAHLPDARRFVPIAIEACRSNVRTVFEANACENPYPARFLPDAGFHQMVLKAIFLGTPVDRIDGLASRATIELARMVEGYASERRAAGRSVPGDCARITALVRPREESERR